MRQIRAQATIVPQPAKTIVLRVNLVGIFAFNIETSSVYYDLTLVTGSSSSEDDAKGKDSIGIG